MHTLIEARTVPGIQVFLFSGFPVSRSHKRWLEWDNLLKKEDENSHVAEISVQDLLFPVHDSVGQRPCASRASFPIAK
jgi:hypothetical protein